MFTLEGESHRVGRVQSWALMLLALVHFRAHLRN